MRTLKEHTSILATPLDYSFLNDPMNKYTGCWDFVWLGYQTFFPSDKIKYIDYNLNETIKTIYD